MMLLNQVSGTLDKRFVPIEYLNDDPYQQALFDGPAFRAVFGENGEEEINVLWSGLIFEAFIYGSNREVVFHLLVNEEENIAMIMESPVSIDQADLLLSEVEKFNHLAKFSELLPFVELP
ncbi:hypothetical protein R6242_18790 [Iodobacter sp. CM08]|uniref:hypothetical protein n=1 Tax=Iodobacter sp. CM08 TaxID=3085902 RepID=UPI00298170C6|nr:hypothetical protein [Iodobacter sp. CM08]MDW5418616.1 hypothetical protein [Iodobacter sp. CM08]